MLKERTKWSMAIIAFVILFGLILLANAETTADNEEFVETYIETGYVSNIENDIATINVNGKITYTPKEELKNGDFVRIATDEEGNFLFVDKIPQ